MPTMRPGSTLVPACGAIAAVSGNGDAGAAAGAVAWAIAVADWSASINDASDSVTGPPRAARVDGSRLTRQRRHTGGHVRRPAFARGALKERDIRRDRTRQKYHGASSDPSFTRTGQHTHPPFVCCSTSSTNPTARRVDQATSAIG